jgi:hypothetical protein
MDEPSLVKRLRAFYFEDAGGALQSPDLCREAADEIERLQQLLRELWRVQDPEAWDEEFAAEVSAVCKT